MGIARVLLVEAILMKSVEQMTPVVARTPLLFRQTLKFRSHVGPLPSYGRTTVQFRPAVPTLITESAGEGSGVGEGALLVRLVGALARRLGRGLGVACLVLCGR